MYWQIVERLVQALHVGDLPSHWKVVSFEMDDLRTVKVDLLLICIHGKSDMRMVRCAFLAVLLEGSFEIPGPPAEVAEEGAWHLFEVCAANNQQPTEDN